MIRRRILIGATSAAISLGAVIAPGAMAGSHWSPTRCRNTYIAWYKHNIGPLTKAPTARQTRQANAYLKGLEKTHHCVIGG
jgi:hypothetical protein